MKLNDIVVVEVDGGRLFVGKIYHIRENGWPCIETEPPVTIASGPAVDCWCANRATHLVDSDSYIWQQSGMPVCDEHAVGMDPVETRIC